MVDNKRVQGTALDTNGAFQATMVGQELVCTQEQVVVVAENKRVESAGNSGWLRVHLSSDSGTACIVSRPLWVHTARTTSQHTNIEPCGGVPLCLQPFDHR